MKVLAVVIGNNDYFEPDKLKNAVNDAKSMEDVFQRLGYTIISGYDCNNNNYCEILRDFEQKLAYFDASIFYYAGHGFQEEGENYLPSVDCQVSEADKYTLGRNSIRLTELIDIYRKYEDKTHIAILDACRTRTTKRGGNDSFAPVSAPQGTLLAFSTSPNCAAKDTIGGEHSVYTEALLSYLGRENLMVEDLFKKVRRTVAQWTNNTQIPWEHTSLITDFRFNTGQMVASPQIPYKENVVRDAEYDEVGDIADLIREIRVCDYNRQNPAINKLRSINAATLDRNQQFIFGRNLLQASYMSFSAQYFMSSLSQNLRKYSTQDGENHVLNGILFEIYFDSHGEFREVGLKLHSFEAVMALRKHPEYVKSFNFIRAVLSPYRDYLIYTIPEDNSQLDVDITVREEVVDYGDDIKEPRSIITRVSVNGVDITDQVRFRFERSGRSLQESIALVAKAPIDAVEIHPNIPLLTYIEFERKPIENLFE